MGRASGLPRARKDRNAPCRCEVCTCAQSIAIGECCVRARVFHVGWLVRSGPCSGALSPLHLCPLAHFWARKNCAPLVINTSSVLVRSFRAAATQRSARTMRHRRKDQHCSAMHSPHRPMQGMLTSFRRNFYLARHIIRPI